MRVHVEVHGCATTQAEGSTLRALAQRAGHHLVDQPEGADAVVLVTCTVVDTTERRMLERIHDLNQQVDTLVVSGCMASAQETRIQEAAPHALILPPGNLDQLGPLLEEGRFTPAPVDKAGLPRTIEDGIATIVINDGCLSKCTFCITKLARPGLRSYPIDSIVDAVQEATQRGATEIRLTSMDTGAYGRDLGKSLPDLLAAVAEVEGEHKVRLGMLNPFLGIPFLDEMLEVLAEPAFYDFLHIPVQSGSDKILDDMDRHHTVEDFEHVCQRAREVLDEPTLSTDVIVGYPTETDEDHQATVELLDRTRPGHVNVTRFSPRPGTPAFRLEEIDGWRVKERSRELSKVRDTLQSEHRARLVGRTVEVTATEHIVEGTTQCRTDAYDPVVVPTRVPVGTRLRAQIIGATKAHGEGEIVEVLDPEHRVVV